MGPFLKNAAAVALALTCAAAPMTASAQPIYSAAPASASSCTLIELLVVIAVKDSSGRTVQTVTTDSKGGFMLKGLAPGSYSLTISGPSLTKALGASGQSDKPPIIAILIGLLLPAVQKTVLSDKGPALRRDRASFQDLHFSKLLMVTEAGATFKGGVTVAVGDLNGDGLAD